MIRLGALLDVSRFALEMQKSRDDEEHKMPKCYLNLTEVSALRASYSPEGLHWVRPDPRFALFVG